MPSATNLMLAALLATAGAGAGCGDPDDGGTGWLQFPLRGTLNEDFYYSFHQDHAGDPSAQDHQCGPKAYDGHLGTDIMLPTFAQMDAGVDIVAAAAGVVMEVHDGEPDRNTAGNPGGFGNHVVLAHDGGFQTIYGHMARSSVAVAPGDAVAPGTQLGRVGSSGNSDAPHLHFELRSGLEPIDPFAGPCSTATSAWIDEDPYDLTVRVIGAGVTTQALDCARILQPPPQVATVSTAEPRVHFWLSLHNVSPELRTEIRIFRPDGALHRSVPGFSFDAYYGLGWMYQSFVPAELATPGTWRVELHRGPDLLVSRSFALVAASGAAPDPASLPPDRGGGSSLGDR